NTSQPTPATRQVAKSSSLPVMTLTPKPPSAHSSTNSALSQSISGRCTKAGGSWRSTVGPSPACTYSSRTSQPSVRLHQQERTPMTLAISYATHDGDPADLLQITEVTDPPPPAPGQIQVDVRAFPIHPG